MFCWHKWGKWSPPENGIACDSPHGLEWFAVSQTRACGKCGVIQVRHIPNLRRLDSGKESR